MYACICFRRRAPLLSSAWASSARRSGTATATAATYASAGSRRRARLPRDRVSRDGRCHHGSRWMARATSTRFSIGGAETAWEGGFHTDACIGGQQPGQAIANPPRLLRASERAALPRQTSNRLSQTSIMIGMAWDGRRCEHPVHAQRRWRACVRRSISGPRSRSRPLIGPTPIGLIMYSPPGPDAESVSYRVANLETGVVAEGTVVDH